MREYEFISLATVSFPTYFSFHCPDGFRTSDLEIAKKHGFDRGRNGASVSMEPKDLFQAFDVSILPKISKLSMKLEKCYESYFALEYYSDGERFMRHEVWYTSRDMKDGKLTPLVGTVEAPYNYIDQGYDVYLFEKDGYVVVLSALDWERYCDKFEGFRVKADEFYAAWNEMSYPEPLR